MSEVVYRLQYFVRNDAGELAAGHCECAANGDDPSGDEQDKNCEAYIDDKSNRHAGGLSCCANRAMS
ncbi:MAG: hypothetical protein J0H17_04220 [Rhizobiales bacterium]|nr:hypothetical protein [Hyphomicrobiales bacterium]